MILGNTEHKYRETTRTMIYYTMPGGRVCDCCKVRAKRSAGRWVGKQWFCSTCKKKLVDG
jgi:hypothetical protein